MSGAGQCWRRNQQPSSNLSALSTPCICSTFRASNEAQFLIRLDLKQLDHFFPVAQLRAPLSIPLPWMAMLMPVGWHGTAVGQPGFAAPVQHYNSTEGAAFCF